MLYTIVCAWNSSFQWCITHKNRKCRIHRKGIYNIPFWRTLEQLLPKHWTVSITIKVISKGNSMPVYVKVVVKWLESFVLKPYLPIKIYIFIIYEFLIVCVLFHFEKIEIYTFLGQKYRFWNYMYSFIIFYFYSTYKTIL